MRVGAVVLVAMFSCGGYTHYTQDGRLVVSFPDGGEVTSGDGCPCSEIATQIYDSDTGRTLLECVPNAEPSGVVGVCFGAKCCVWSLAQGNAKP